MQIDVVDAGGDHRVERGRIDPAAGIGRADRARRRARDDAPDPRDLRGGDAHERGGHQGIPPAGHVRPHRRHRDQLLPEPHPVLQLHLELGQARPLAPRKRRDLIAAVIDHRAVLGADGPRSPPRSPPRLSLKLAGDHRSSFSEYRRTAASPSCRTAPKNLRDDSPHSLIRLRQDAARPSSNTHAWSSPSISAGVERCGDGPPHRRRAERSAKPGDEKGPDARRRGPRPPRRTCCTSRGAAALSNEADGPLSSSAAHASCRPRRDPPRPARHRCTW